MNVCYTSIPKHWNFVKDVTSKCEFLLPIPNAFKVGTKDYYPRLYKVNDVKLTKTSIVIGISF